MYSMAQQSFSWPDAAAVTALALAAVALVGFAIAGFVQLRTSKIKAGQEDNLRQLVSRYEHLAESTSDAQQRTATDLSEMRSRTVAIEPEVILFDEPCSALDPISTAKIEELMDELKDDYTLVIVTHNMQQGARVSDFTAFMYLGELIEFGTTSRIFTAPHDRRTQDYITGRFG